MARDCEGIVNSAGMECGLTLPVWVVTSVSGINDVAHCLPRVRPEYLGRRITYAGMGIRCGRDRRMNKHLEYEVNQLHA